MVPTAAKKSLQPLTNESRTGMIGRVFKDRTQAGAGLAAALPDLRLKTNVTVIGLARGGVEVAAETAHLLQLPLDVLCVRKVSMPGYPELAMGAVAPQGERFTNRRIASLLNTQQIEEAYEAAMAEARAMDNRLRGGVQMNLVGRVAVIVDDGAATGASVRAAIAAVRNAGARQMIVALPVLPRPAAERLGRECDRLVTLRAPQRFQSVGQFFEDFEPVSEERVRELLAAAQPQVEQTA
ncbi:MAG: putative phosphoribosyl transferase [Gaiellales bacterium]|jgi:predicted phosphoribosyltransferase|nr:putative phosphoribosyl transferase [Gaiellales bacterium]MDX6593501.1 putative phosphoribosyl transferase [Gaiellales bacterium]